MWRRDGWSWHFVHSASTTLSGKSLPVSPQTASLCSWFVMFSKQNHINLTLEYRGVYYSLPIITSAYFSSVCLTGVHGGRRRARVAKGFAGTTPQTPHLTAAKCCQGAGWVCACVHACVRVFVRSDLKCIYSVACSSGNSQRGCQRWAMMGCTQIHTLIHTCTHTHTSTMAGPRHWDPTIFTYPSPSWKEERAERKGKIIICWEIETRSREGTLYEWSYRTTRGGKEGKGEEESKIRREMGQRTSGADRMQRESRSKVILIWWDTWERHC